jgi:hypothetical protein
MRHFQVSIVELMLAVVFIGLFASLAMKTWGDWFFIHGLVGAAILLFVTYLVLAIMVRQHRERREGDRSGKD